MAIERAAVTAAGALESRCAALYTAHRDELLIHAERLLGNADTAADVVQECFIKFYQVLGDGEPRNPRAYLYAMVSNRARDHWRAQARVEWADAPDLPDETTPEVQAIDRQALQRLAQAVDALPPQQQRAFTLRRIEGLSLKAVAARLGISAKTVENHLTAALRRIAEQLQTESQ